MGEARRRKLAGINLGQADADATATERIITWPLSNKPSQLRIEGDLKRLGIDFAKPGFHDSPAFLRAEQKEKQIIDIYAQYVESREYTHEELLNATAKIEIATEAVSTAIARDGRTGLCVVASSVLSRILDELGVWNYCGKATLTVTFPEHLSPDPRYFYAIDQGSFTAPHAIVVAPPFLVLDTTVRHQMYDTRGMAEVLPRKVMATQFIPYAWTDADIAAPEFRLNLGRRRMTVREYLQSRNHQMIKIMGSLPARQVTYAGGRLSYVMVGVGGYTEKLREIDRNVILGGLTPLEIFHESISPRLAQR